MGGQTALRPAAPFAYVIQLAVVDRALIGLSVIPGTILVALLFVFLPIFSSAKGLFATALFIRLLALAGVLGLGLASFKSTYSTHRKRWSAGVLICCGYTSLILGFLVLLKPLTVVDGRMILGIVLLLGVLSWPAIAGLFALRKLWVGYA